jgi:hypothetical protein
MPILWRYYIKAFVPTFVFYTFFLTLLSFLFRFKELLFFLDSGASTKHLFLFIFYNLPFFFTLACPLSAAIAGYLVSQRRSQYLEWSTLSTLGISRGQLLVPILFCGVNLFLLVFWLNADVCPKYRLLGKKTVLEAIYQNPSLIVKHFQSKRNPLALSSTTNGATCNLTVAICDPTTKKLHLIKADKIEKKEAHLLYIDRCIQLIHKEGNCIASKLDEILFDLDELPLSFHFAKTYEEHLPMRSGITLNELLRRLCISILPFSLFFLATAAGMQRNMRNDAMDGIIYLAAGFSCYFIYLIARASNSSLPIVYLITPLIPVPFTLYKILRELR